MKIKANVCPLNIRHESFRFKSLCKEFCNRLMALIITTNYVTEVYHKHINSKMMITRSDREQIILKIIN